MGERSRVYPTPAQEAILREHCAHARYVWNLAVEQQSWHRPGRSGGPGFLAQARQLTEARAEFDWLRAGSRIVQIQALRDYDQAMQHFFAGTHGRPTWRKIGRNEGFWIAAPGRYKIKRLSRKVGAIHIPKVGWVSLRWSQRLPERVQSYRVTLDRVGRWHISFPAPQPAVVREPTGTALGIDRGVRTALVTSDGQHYRAPRISDRQAVRHLALQRRMARQHKDSAKRERTRHAMATIAARTADRRKDWAEKISTRLVREHDLIVLEKLNIAGMTRKPAPKPDPGQLGAFLPNHARAKAGLSQGILASCWGALAERLEQKASASGASVVFVDPRFTSQQCHACGHTAAGNRESQAVFRCVSCGHTDHADANAARNILARGLLLTTGEAVPAHAGGHPALCPQKPAQAAAGTTRSAA